MCYFFVMNTSYTYHTTSIKETLEPHLYIESYKKPEVTKTIHTYKFSKDIFSAEYTLCFYKLVNMTIDICIEDYLNKIKTSQKTAHIYTSPPSTMYARKEKGIDSMLHLLRKSVCKLYQYIDIHKDSTVHIYSVYALYRNYLIHKKAQHLGGTRSTRIRDLYKRYYISFTHKFFIFYLIHIKRYSRFSYTIIDDVSSTGATLAACKQTLVSYLEYIQKKNPHISFDVEIYSLVH